MTVLRRLTCLCRLLICLLAALCATTTNGIAQAQGTYPVKPIRLVVAFASGSSTDAVARVVAEELGRRLKQNVIVENRAGANGQIASAFVAQSAPDGYTLMISSNTTHAANPHLYKKLPYDPVKDFVPIARLGYIPFMLLVHPSLPVKSTAELIAYARAHPGQLTYASSNSTGQVSMETLNILKGTDIVGVSYKSSQQAMIDLVGNQVQIMVCDFAVAQPQLKAGKVRALAVPSAKRSSLRPDLPAMRRPSVSSTSRRGMGSGHRRERRVISSFDLAGKSATLLSSRRCAASWQRSESKWRR